MIHRRFLISTNTSPFRGDSPFPLSSSHYSEISSTMRCSCDSLIGLHAQLSRGSLVRRQNRRNFRLRYGPSGAQRQRRAERSVPSTAITMPFSQCFSRRAKVVRMVRQRKERWRQKGTNQRWLPFDCTTNLAIDLLLPSLTSLSALRRSTSPRAFLGNYSTRAEFFQQYFLSPEPSCSRRMFWLSSKLFLLIYRQQKRSMSCPVLAYKSPRVLMNITL